MRAPRYGSRGFAGGFIDGARHRFLRGDPTSPYVRLTRGVATLAALLAFGVVGYMIIEGWSFLDALYMTVISVTTVGYNEVRPLSDGGRVFTIFVILFGVGTALYILTILVQTVVEGELAAAFGVRRMQARIDALSDHYILCGYGRVGDEIATEFNQRNVPFVVVDTDEDAIARSLEAGHLVIEGDATRDDVLKQAGIDRARALMAASDSDAGNTYITLAAKALRPDLYVIARVAQAAGEPRARRAGADRVVSPYTLAGRRMALSALQPLTVEFFDLLASERGGDQVARRDAPLHLDHPARHPASERRCRRWAAGLLPAPAGRPPHAVEQRAGPHRAWRDQGGRDPQRRRGRRRGSRSLAPRGELAEHVLQDPSMLVVADLHRRLDARDD